MKELLRTVAISKYFGSLKANDDINITLRSGEILALLGENGAGKSTLMNVLFGLYQPTSGEILLDGQATHFHSPKDAIAKGLGMVHQHFMLVDTLSVAENIILGAEPARWGIINYRAARAAAIDISRQYGLTIDPNAIVGDISVGQQQRVEILKALYRQARLLILDEPTAVLTPQEVEELFVVIRRLCENGLAVIIITHKLEEVKKIADRVYILRRGRVVGESRTDLLTKEELANLMVGREVVLTVKKKDKVINDPPLVEISGLSVRDSRGCMSIDNISLNIRPGEIVGIAGVAGNGQTELTEGLIGLRNLDSGSIMLHGNEITQNSILERIQQNISYVPADRHRYGLVLPMTVSENMVIGYHMRPQFIRNGILLHDAFRSFATDLTKKYDIRAESVNTAVQNLSGGNQQKVILARELSREPQFLIVSQPTRGLDVGAIEYIHRQILAMRDRNVAILLISLELEEIMSLSDRILVLYRGKIVYETTSKISDERTIGTYMMGMNTSE